MLSTNIDLLVAAFFILNVVFLAGAFRLGRMQPPLTLDDIMPAGKDERVDG